MRLLFDDTDLHCWFPGGTFTVHADDSVHWRTPVDPTREFAITYTEAEVCVPPPREAELDALYRRFDVVRDVAVMGDGRLAAVVGDAPKLMVVDDAGEPVWQVDLRMAGRRSPAYSDQEYWSEDEAFEGTDQRGLRIEPSRDGVVVTANESGHAAFFDASGTCVVCWRVPAAPENTVFAARLDGALLIGVLFNGRHSELHVLTDEGEVLAKWPPQGEVRWGMTTPIVADDRVVVYSDEGPNRKHLHLLSLPDLDEVYYCGPLEWPVAAAVNEAGSLFAVASPNQLLLASVEAEEIVVLFHRTIGELLNSSDAERPDPPATATVDGRGERIWFDGDIDFLHIRSGGEVIYMRLDDYAICARTISGDAREILPPRPIQRLDFLGDLIVGDPGPKVEIFERRFHPRIWDVSDREILMEEGGERFRLNLESGEKTVISIPHGGGVMETMRMFGDGVFFAVSERSRESFDDDVRWQLLGSDGSVQMLSTSNRRTAMRVAAVACEEAMWWVEWDTSGEYRLCRLDLDGSVSRWSLDREVRALSVRGTDAFVITVGGPDSPEGYDARLVQRVGPDGALTPVSHVPLPFGTSGLVVGSTAAYVLEGPSFGGGRNPSQIHRIDLETGESALLAREVFAELSQLRVAEARVWWLEGQGSQQKANAMVFGGGQSVPVSGASICWVQESD